MGFGEVIGNAFTSALKALNDRFNKTAAKKAAQGAVKGTRRPTKSDFDGTARAFSKENAERLAKQKAEEEARRRAEEEKRKAEQESEWEKYKEEAIKTQGHKPEVMAQQDKSEFARKNQEIEEAASKYADEMLTRDEQKHQTMQPSEKQQEKLKELTGDTGWHWTDEHGYDTSAKVPAYDYKAEADKLAASSGQPIHEEAGGGHVRASFAPGRVYLSDAYNANGVMESNPRFTASTLDDDEAEGDDTVPKTREEVLAKHRGGSGTVREGINTLAGYIRNGRDILRDWVDEGEDYKVRTSGGKEIDESELLEQLPDYMNSLESHTGNGRREVVFLDPNTEQEIMRADVSGMSDEEANDLVKNAELRYNDAEGTVTLGDSGVAVPSYVDDEGLVQMTPFNFRVDFTPESMKMSNGTEVTIDDLLDIQQHAGEEGTRYSAGSSHAIMNGPLGGAIREISREYDVNDENGNFDISKLSGNIVPWMTDMLGDTLPYLIPGVGKIVAAADVGTAAQGVDPYTYDPITHTYADPGAMTEGDYWGNLLASGIESAGEYALGLGGEGVAKGIRHLLGRNTPEAAAKAAYKAGVQNPVIGTMKNAGKTAGEEGAEEVLQTLGEEWAHQLDSDSAGWFANQMDVDEEGQPNPEALDASGQPKLDPNTSTEDRIENAKSQLLQSFLGGSLLGGGMGLPGAAAQQRRARQNVQGGNLSWDEKNLRSSGLTDEDMEEIERQLNLQNGRR